MKPWTEEREWKPNTATQSRRVLRKKSLRSETDLSKSSKCWLFISCQMHHIKQWGIAIQIVAFRCLPTFPCQQANSSTSVHRPQIKSNRAMDKVVVYWFPISFTHTTPIQNQNFPFLKILLIVKIFPKVVVQIEKETLEGTLDFQIVFQGKDWLKLFVRTR